MSAATLKIDHSPQRSPREAASCKSQKICCNKSPYLRCTKFPARGHCTTTPCTYARYTSAHTQISRGLVTGGTMSTVGPASGGGVAEIIGGLSCDLAAR